MRGSTPRLASLGLAIASLALGSCGTRDREVPCPPACNVLLISIDTLRADHMSLYGYARQTTPRIDTFAQDSFVFESATSQSAWTTPAHASMLTGLYPAEHGLVFYSNPGILRKANSTLAEILRKRDYRTAGFNGGGYVSDDFGFERGFEVYRGQRRMAPNIEDALVWIRQQRHEPFFLFVHGFDVHRPYLPPLRFDLFNETGRKWDIKRFCYPGRRSVESPEHLEYIVSQYDAGVRHADHLVGKLLEQLEREELLDHTIVVITSDHGDEFFEHGDCDHIRTLHGELLHVPLIVRVPGTTGGRISARVAASVAITPTVLDLLEIGFRLPDDRSLRPWLEDNTLGSTPVLSETGFDKVHLRSLIDEPWKLILRTDLETGVEVAELYQLQQDPGELRDRSKDHPEIVAALAGRAQALPRPIPPRPRDLSPELTRELEALGYVD